MTSATNGSKRGTIFEAAGRLIARGYWVVPNIPRGKRPYHPNWPALRITENELAEYFKPADNLGVITGEASKNLVCVDMDSEVARQLAPLFLPPTPVVCGRTNNPEGHRFYVVEKSVPGRKWKLGDDDAKRFGFANTVELLATGEQVVVGPSIHETGDVYHLLEGEPATVSADELLAACTALDKAVRAKLGIEDQPQRKPERKTEATTQPATNRDDALKRAAAYLDKIPGAISGQGGHDHTFKTAIKLVAFGLSRDDVFDLLARWNERCEPPWTDGELWHKIDDAFKTNPEPMEDRPRSGTTGTNGQHTKAGHNSGEHRGGIVRNYRLADIATDDGNKTIPIPLSMADISGTIHELAEGWPRRVGSQLFVPNTSGTGVAWLADTDAVFGYLGQATGHPPDFRGMSGYHQKREVFSCLTRTATEYRAVEELPHEPRIANHFYACPIPASGQGDRLHELVGRFAPETDIDRDLILAGFVTPFWGGRGGSRPAFCITSDAGKGCGKTTLAACISELAGGAVDVSANEEIATIKTRLLSPEGRTKRVAWLDNVKSHRLSWAELESLITTPVISGRLLYVGEGSRPNNVTFVLTMNGASLSADMAQRTAIIKLRKPEYSGTWTEETRKFIHDHRTELIADVMGFLRSPVATLAKFSRWGDWERDVLARLPEPSEAQAVIRERQVGVDVDGEESALVEEFFSKQLERLGYDTQTDRVFIPSSVAARWLTWATAERVTVAKATRTLKQRITEGQLRKLLVCPRNDLGRGFEYWGDDATGSTPLQRDIEDQIRNRGEYCPT